MSRKYRTKLILSFLIICATILFIFSYYHTNIKVRERVLKCIIFDKVSKCLAKDEDVYIRSLEVQQTFDVHGYLNKSSNIFHLKQNNLLYFNTNDYAYNSRKKYLFFDKYIVELRPKVKWISDEGVPLSIQWSTKEYHYPIQIAQYGLSHYSKWVDLKEKQALIDPLDLLDSGKDKHIGNVKATKHKYVKFTKNGITFFSIHAVTEDVFLSVSSFTHYGNEFTMDLIKPYIKSMPFIESTLPDIFVVGTEWSKESGVHFKIKNSAFGIIHLFYICENLKNREAEKNVFVYFISNCISVRLVRNLYVDIVKLIPAKVFERDPSLLSKLKYSSIDAIFLHGQGKISIFKICNQFSYEKFMDSSNWLLQNQDKEGGWPTNVTRKIYSNVKLKPGWYSAMAQGHAISVLMRAFHCTNDLKYMKAASNALKLFEINTTEKGVRTYFLGHEDLVWYEEYPTYPSLFVLNGFIYSLFGLFDFTEISSSELSSQKADKLLKAGLMSLQTLLPLFDSGFGSFYDLRHVTFPAAKVAIHKTKVRPLEVHDGPNRARWEYHAVHIEQLLFLAHIIYPENKVLLSTANRFIHYLHGYRSAHN